MATPWISFFCPGMPVFNILKDKSSAGTYQGGYSCVDIFQKMPVQMAAGCYI